MTDINYDINDVEFRNSRVNPDETFYREHRTIAAEKPIFQHSQKDAPTAPYRRHGNKTIISAQGRRSAHALRIDDEEGCEGCNIEHRRKQNEYKHFVIKDNHTVEIHAFACQRGLSLYRTDEQKEDEEIARKKTWWKKTKRRRDST